MIPDFEAIAAQDRRSQMLKGVVFWVAFLVAVTAEMWPIPRHWQEIVNVVGALICGAILVTHVFKTS